MTTARSSQARRTIVAIGVGALITLAVAPASAHRRDEYLQAARIAIDPHQVEIALDLTPGIAVATAMLAEIDSDRDGVLTERDADLYAARVLGDLRVELDGAPLALAVRRREVPAVDAVVNGAGTLRLQLIATVAPLTAGRHRLLYRNVHHSDIGVYLANALVPATDRIAVLAQRRDVTQSELMVEYLLSEGTALDASWWALVSAGAALTLATAVRWRARRRPRLTI